ncbi:MAG TPA: TonB family protein [Pyrinomonadaceae bacterium]|nr:TonB family protein [Pyrinomonadaceae bacterium]
MRHLILFLLMVVALSVFASGQTKKKSSLSREEVEAGVQLYDNGNYVEARRHFEAALALDPSNRNIPLLIARAIHRQYQPGVRTLDNYSVGMEAVAAYEKALGGSSRSVSEALHASVELLTQMGDTELANLWLVRLAAAWRVPSVERSAAYTALAARKLECARSIAVAAAPGANRVLADIGASALCALEGLTYAKNALVLDPGNIAALEHQTNLQLEQQKLEQMGNEHVAGGIPVAPAPGQKVEGEGSRNGESDDASADGEVVDLRQIALDKGLRLAGMAIRKPEPVYPAEAKTARVSGTVTVMVNTDEEGKVVSAFARTGHYLLRQAAVRAAQRAQFLPAHNSDVQARKSTYMITYDFVLKDGP